MKEKIRFKGRVHWAVVGPLYLAGLLAILDIIAYFFNVNAGLIVSVFLVVYLAAVFALFRSNKEAIYQELFQLGGYYNESQDGLLEGLEVPYAVLEPDGKILWMNERFRKITGKEKNYHRAITGIFSSMTKEFLAKLEDVEHDTITYEDRIYRVTLRREIIPDYLGKYLETNTPRGGKEVISLTLLDKTMQMEYERKYEEEKVAVGLLYLDNYDEVAERLEEVKASILQVLVERKINRYFAGKDVIIRRFDHDKYIILFKQKLLDHYKEDRFSIVQSIREVKVGNEMSVTLSLGIGAKGESYSENHEYAKAALDLALGRGGDQVVLKENEEIDYFAGATMQVERQTTRVKARIKAQALYEMMSVNENILIMGHHIGDVDSFGASIGIYSAARKLGKNAHIVIDQVTSSMRPLKELFSEKNGYPADMFYTPERAIEVADRETMVMVVDVNRPSYTECPELLEISDKVVVFDHHRHGNDTISGAVLSYIEPYASSTCEMVTEVLQYFTADFKITQQEADSIYAGIIIDTNNFMTKTGVRTFEAAAYLRRAGADVTRVRKMLQNDMAAYKARAAAVRDALVYKNCFALTKCPTEDVESPTVAGAQASNELLNIIGIKASFVFTDYNGVIYISARSIDEIDVQSIMNKLGGGGHLNVAGAQLRDCTIDEAIERTKQVIDEMIERGDIVL